MRKTIWYISHSLQQPPDDLGMVAAAEVAAAGAGGEAAREADGALPRPLGGS